MYNMHGFSKKQFRLHRAASTVLLAVYLLVTTSVDLFHNEDCMFGAVQPTNVICHNDSCPACRFLDSSNSAELDFNPYLVITTSQVISQPLPHLMVVNYDEWSCSIIPRAPPSITIS